MTHTWVAPRVRQALDQLDADRQRLVREYQQLAASFEDGDAGRGKDSWLAAKRYEHFASYLAAYDAASIEWDITDLRRLLNGQAEELDRRKRRRWRRFRRRLR